MDARHAGFTSLSAITKLGAGQPACMMAKLQPRACRMEVADYMMRVSDT